MSVTISAWQRCSVRLCLQVFVGTHLCLIYVICICLRVVVSNTYCVVFLLCFSSSCVPYIASSLDCPFLIAPSVFSDVYYQTILVKLEFNLDLWFLRKIFFLSSSDKPTRLIYLHQKYNICRGWYKKHVCQVCLKWFSGLREEYWNIFSDIALC